MIRRTLLATLLVVLLSPVSFVHAQAYPTKPIKLVVPFPAGGGVDALGRALAEQLAVTLGQPVIVENRPGASGNIGAEFVARAAPDGHTLFLAGEGPLVVNKLVQAHLSFDPDKFEPISLLTYTPMMIVVNPKVPARTLQELISYAKANPGKISYASAGKGGPSHLAAELFQSATGTRFLHVPYKGIAPAFNDVLAGHVDMMFGFEASVGPYMQAGDKVRVLAVTGAKRHPALPDVPTVAEFIPGFLTVSWTALVAPGGTPANVLNKVSTAAMAAMRMPDVVARMREQGYEIEGSTSASAKAYIKQATERSHQAVRTAGITPE
ncbi:Bug family tripartite tricarboxylate transporter substrate binding protein [Pigmentiphaga litoralis]|uniref:Tripartite-type tricarboxylate transporter receptor subunit TctC n=1 Tax=Pigmentiphaga litoralis TaxID=516702 RepID=A0A7Y9IS46_9BURK|nr:tripartite tricarboxylate transporter substrate binding protein [Pigmentiphaga litoralis]NYE24566.1 tripartite-type tricarboxylate transporter receptor subunit TctC [Pigmentiphaga litoralis]NYE81820.1 tripartite-type tricarboxylate transporter receptor subunit TctC [Pigmentiphaga litoralis]